MTTLSKTDVHVLQNINNTCSHSYSIDNENVVHDKIVIVVRNTDCFYFVEQADRGFVLLCSCALRKGNLHQLPISITCKMRSC